jgi:hypothetical protein
VNDPEIGKGCHLKSLESLNQPVKETISGSGNDATGEFERQEPLTGMRIGTAKRTAPSCRG